MVMMIMLPTVESRTFRLQEPCLENVKIIIHKTNFFMRFFKVVKLLL
jgi:hypothetical protein